MDIRCIDRETGKATFTRVRTVVSRLELPSEFTVGAGQRIAWKTLRSARIYRRSPPVEMYLAAQSISRVIFTKGPAKPSVTSLI
jgi:hypothetical protein